MQGCKIGVRTLPNTKKKKKSPLLRAPYQLGKLVNELAFLALLRLKHTCKHTKNTQKSSILFFSLSSSYFLFHVLSQLFK